MTSTGARPATYAEIADILEELPEIVRHARRLYGISHRALSEIAGGSPAYSSIYRLENRTGTIELTSAIALLKALDALTRGALDRAEAVH